MQDVIEFVRQDNCFECGGKGSIDLYDEKGKSYNYTTVINNKQHDNMILEFINSNTLNKFKCRKCGKEFTIGWEGNFPIPLLDNLKIKNFVLSFKKE